MSVIDEILWLLRDGNWLYLEEIGENIPLSKFKIDIAVNFLGEYRFVQLDKNRKRIRLQTSILKFINKIQNIEKEEILSH